MNSAVFSPQPNFAIEYGLFEETGCPFMSWHVSFCPEGTVENTPAVYCWGTMPFIKGYESRRDGWKFRRSCQNRTPFSRPFGTLRRCIASISSDKSLGYFRMSLWDKRLRQPTASADLPELKMLARHVLQ